VIEEEAPSMDDAQRGELRRGFLIALPMALVWIVLVIIGVLWVHAAWIFVLAAMFFLIEMGALWWAFTRAH
jgi:uncharacterized membrane protein